MACVGVVPVMAATTQSSDGQIEMRVFSSSAPNAFGSNDWNMYVSNTLAYLQNGTGLESDNSTNAGNYTQTGPTIPVSEIVVSSFNSWKGIVPGSDPGEFGHRVHFGLAIEAQAGTSFKLEDLTYSIVSSDGNLLGFSGDFSGSGFSPTRIGIKTDGSLATSNTDSLRALYYVGVGNAYVAYEVNPGDSNQQQIDNVHSYVDGIGGVTVTGTYGISYSGNASGVLSGSDTLQVVPAVPEPQATVLLGTLGLLMILRRRNR